MENPAQFEEFEGNLKLFEEGKTYNEMTDTHIKFNSKTELLISNLTDPEIIIKEISTISKKQYYYNAIYESQKRILQQVENEYDKWFNAKYIEIVNETEPKIVKSGRTDLVKIKRTEVERVINIKTRWAAEYEHHQNNIMDEKYKLGLVAVIKKSLDSYSYKLSNINEYAKNLD